MLLGKRPHPLIGKFSQFLLSGGRTAVNSANPRSPMDMTQNLQSTKGPKSFDLGGVGLGIVAALDKPGLQVLPKYAVCSSNLNRSGPNPVHSVNRSVNEDEDEDFTFVTFRVPNMTITKVYYDGGEGGIMKHGGGFNDVKNAKTNNINVVGFENFPPTQTLLEAEPSFPTSYFLSSCLLCRKNLHGKDIYMYRGEKAFCSSECRASQIMMEEWKEQCALEASRSRELSSSPYTKDQMFSTGILAI